MDENQFFAYRSVLCYLRKKDYSQFMALKELKNVLNVEVSMNWVKKWWNAPMEQLAGRAGKSRLVVIENSLDRKATKKL